MSDLIDNKDTKVYLKGFEKGMQEGLLKGKLEGKLEGIQEVLLEGKLEGILQGIEMVLDSKFGIEGLRLMPKIRKVKDMYVLKTIFAALRIAKTVEEVRSIYQPTVLY